MEFEQASAIDDVVEVSFQIVEVNNLRAFSGSVAPVLYGQVRREGQASDDCMPGVSVAFGRCMQLPKTEAIVFHWNA